jgi:hypothetical protein
MAGRVFEFWELCKSLAKRGAVRNGGTDQATTMLTASSPR